VTQRASAAAVLAVSGALLLATCGTKVVTLDRSCEAAPLFPAPFCIKYTGTAGLGCKACYDRCGESLSDSCGPARPGETCVTREDRALVRCVHCVDATGAEEQVACLSCNPPDADGCAECRWSDGIGGVCRRCVDSATNVGTDDCDRQRPELP
jgi:hypothetical protein